MFGEVRLRDGHGLTHFIEVTKLAVTEGMVQQLPSFLRGASRRTHDMQNRYMLGETARDTVHGAKLAHSKGGQQRGKPFAARVAIRGVGGVQFVSTTHPANIRAGDNVIEEL